ncbi:MAG: hypothetical protein ABSH08_20295 [Tepidisphaeraceae bacterium]|jgi:hypothetical protein
MDPFQGLATFVLGRLKDSAIALWWKLLFLCVFSAVVSFLAVDGGFLIRGASELVARGWGYSSAAGALVLCFLANGQKLLKGMVAIIPNQEVIAALETQYQQVQADKEQKK